MELNSVWQAQSGRSNEVEVNGPCVEGRVKVSCLSKSGRSWVKLDFRVDRLLSALKSLKTVHFLFQDRPVSRITHL